jgi:hypothetical protein
MTTDTEVITILGAARSRTALLGRGEPWAVESFRGVLLYLV